MFFFKAKAEVCLHEGDSEYEKDEFYNAIDCYTRGIKAGCRDKSLNATLFTNRATVHLYMGENLICSQCVECLERINQEWQTANPVSH